MIINCTRCVIDEPKYEAASALRSRALRVYWWIMQ